MQEELVTDTIVNGINYVRHIRGYIQKESNQEAKEEALEDADIMAKAIAILAIESISPHSTTNVASAVATILLCQHIDYFCTPQSSRYSRDILPTTRQLLSAMCDDLNDNEKVPKHLFRTLYKARSLYPKLSIVKDRENIILSPLSTDILFAYVISEFLHRYYPRYILTVRPIYISRDRREVFYLPKDTVFLSSIHTGVFLDARGTGKSLDSISYNLNLPIAHKSICNN